MAAFVLGDAPITRRATDGFMISQMKTVEGDDRRFKKMFAELSMQNELVKETRKTWGWGLSFLNLRNVEGIHRTTTELMGFALR